MTTGAGQRSSRKEKKGPSRPKRKERIRLVEGRAASNRSKNICPAHEAKTEGSESRGKIRKRTNDTFKGGACCEKGKGGL
jgi:hypothetical protein